MHWNIRSVLFVVGALLLAISNKRPNRPKDQRDQGQNHETSADHGQQPINEMLRAEWAAFQGTIREIHESEKRHQEAERKLSAAQLGTAKGLNRITLIGAIVGVLGLIGVAASIIIAKRAADDAHDALIAANRAWVGPKNVAIVSPVVKDSGIALQIFYENSGREPAINAAVLHGNDVFTETEWSDGTASHYMIAAKDDCLLRRELPREQVGVVYPGSGHSYSLTFNTGDPTNSKPVVVDGELTSGDKIFVLYGCILYKTFFAIRHSAFCSFYWIKGSAGQNMGTCRVGNDAD